MVQRLKFLKASANSEYDVLTRSPTLTMLAGPTLERMSSSYPFSQDENPILSVVVIHYHKCYKTAVIYYAFVNTCLF